MRGLKDTTTVVFEAPFAGALLDPGQPVPPGLVRSGGHAPVRRFNVYRNNVVVSLIASLQTRFPAVERIVGPEFFAACARIFVGQHPPRSKLMMTYGDDFPAFLAGFGPSAELPYLADVARIEAARTRAYHAADAEAFDPQELTSRPPDELFAARLILHPSVQTIRSAFPAVTIWAMNSGEAELGPVDLEHAEAALVARQNNTVFVRALPPGGVEFLNALQSGTTLGEAAHAGASASADFDVAANLAGLIGSGLLAGVSASTSHAQDNRP
jgi:hypothetical protein